MSILSKEIGRYVDKLLADTDEIVHDEAADSFIEAHESMLDEYVVGVIRRYIKDEIKKRSQVAAPAFGQGVLFEGLPAAVTVEDGRTKPLRACTWDDLMAGREFKVENIDYAREALRAYDRDLARLKPYLDGTPLSVDDVIEQVAA